jgi:hypothetical protein
MGVPIKFGESEALSEAYRERNNDDSCWSRSVIHAENRMKSLGQYCETEAYVQRGCFIHATQGRTATTTGMEHRALEKDKIPWNCRGW